MKITEVKTVLLTGPSGNDPYLNIARKRRSAAFIELHTDTELIGLGETYLGYHAPEIVPAIVEFFAPILEGISDNDIQPRRLWDRMYRCANFWARTGAGVNVLAGLEAALWDLKGRMAGVPVYELLGGRVHDRLFGYATGAYSNYPWSELLHKIDLYREDGFRAVKLGAGYLDVNKKTFFRSASSKAWADMEAEKVEAIRSHAGSDFVICLDGHMSNVPEGETVWDTGMAKAVLQALEPYDIFFYEEPLHYNNMDGYAELCRSTSIPIAGGEVLTTREEFFQFAQANAFDIAQPDASHIGIAPFLDVARMFAARNKRAATHAWSAGVGVMANIHAAFATPNIAILELPPLAGELHTEIYADGYRFKDGYVLPPEAPGLGARLPDTLKEKYPFVPGSGEWNPVAGRETLM